jgi:3-dehydroquinate dehydratase-2
VKILIANGVNLDLLGKREVEHYGVNTLADIEALVRDFCAKHFAEQKVQLSFSQTNDEAKFLGELDKGWDGVVINAGAWTHTSLAIADRLKALNIKYVEVHISNLSRREEIRQKSLLAPGALGVVYGMGAQSYLAGLTGLISQLEQ